MTYPMYQWATDLFPIHRSLTGDGVRQTLRYIKELLPNLAIHEVPSGTKAFDWTVPKEWVCREAHFDHRDNRYGDLRNSNLHVVQYSTPFDGQVTWEELDQHLHSLPEQPEAIPYVTSYYEETWGFCIEHWRRELLRNSFEPHSIWTVKIDSELKDGHLTYGELIIPGAESTEVLLSTNICHPSMANNELSGPVVVTALAQWLASEPRRHTYRILFLPETIGALVYLSREAPNKPPDWLGPLNYDVMHQRVIAGYQVVCCGDTRTYGYLPSRNGDTLADRAALAALRPLALRRFRWGRWWRRRRYRLYSFSQDRGSDERQWCAQGVDLPVGSIMRSKYDTYPEYHTSLDDLSFISQEGLEGSLKVYQRAIDIIEANRVYKATCIGEPQLGSRGLYQAGGTRDLVDLAETIGVNVLECARIAEQLKEQGLLE